MSYGHFDNTMYITSSRIFERIFFVAEHFLFYLSIFTLRELVFVRQWQWQGVKRLKRIARQVKRLQLIGLGGWIGGVFVDGCF